MIPCAQFAYDFGNKDTDIDSSIQSRTFFIQILYIVKNRADKSFHFHKDVQERRNTPNMYDHALPSQRYNLFHEKMKMICPPVGEWSNIQNICSRLPQVPMKIILYGFHRCFTQKEEGRLHQGQLTHTLTTDTYPSKVSDCK